MRDFIDIVAILVVSVAGVPWATWVLIINDALE